MALDSEPERLTLQLSARDERLEIRATADRGEARGETTAPAPGLLAPVARYEPGDYPESVLAPLGLALYKTLLVGDVGRLAADLLGDARAAEQAVRFELRFDPDQVAMAGFPWELIRNEQGQFLVRNGIVDLTRYISYPQPPPTLDAGLRDRPFLRVTAQPPSLPAIELGDLGLPRIETLLHASFTGLSQKLLVEGLPPWGLQFDGHGALLLQCRRCDGLSVQDVRFCRACGHALVDAKRVGGLAFERRGQIEWVAAADVGSVLYNSHVRLAMLLSCESARVGDSLVWSGLAPNLILAGVPAVVGMQYPIFDSYANLFARTFYAALLRTGDVVAALHVARRIDPREAWYSPVLYLRHQQRSPASPALPVFHERRIDTAAPGGVQAGLTFLVRLWIRRPETPPMGEALLRRELDIPADLPIQIKEYSAEVKFRPVPGRLLRRGEVDVNLTGIGCEILRSGITLFVDEHLDAPPAIFVVRAADPGHATLIFEVCQDGGQIASIIHQLEVRPSAGLAAGSFTPIAVSANLLPLSPSRGQGTTMPSVPAIICEACGASNGPRAIFCAVCGAALALPGSAPAPAPPPQPSSEPVRQPRDGSTQPPVPYAAAPSVAPHADPSPRPVPLPGRSRWGSVSPTALAASGWALTGGLKSLGGRQTPGIPSRSTALDLALGLCAGILIAWAIRRSEPRLRPAYLPAIAVAWAIAWLSHALLLDLFFRQAIAARVSADPAVGAALARVGAGIVSGVTGGALTALVLGFAPLGLPWRSRALIVAGWACAFLVAELMSPLITAALPAVVSSAVFWGLIAGTGNALMLRVIEHAWQSPP